MNKEEVIKALEICTSYDRDCTKCPYQSYQTCTDNLMWDALDVLKNEEIYYQRAVEEYQHNAHYEPSFNPDDGSM